MVKSETCLYTPPEHVKGVLFLRFCMKTWEQLSDTCKNKKKHTHTFLPFLPSFLPFLLGHRVFIDLGFTCRLCGPFLLKLQMHFSVGPSLDPAQDTVLLWNSETFQCWILWWQWPVLNNMETAVDISQFSRLNDTHLFPTHLLQVSTRNLLLHPEGLRENTKPVSADGIPTNLIFKFSRFQWPYYCDQQRG
jgi:hypothetical protein